MPKFLCFMLKILFKITLLLSQTSWPHFAEVGNVDYLMKFFAIEQLEPNGYGTKKDILKTLLMDNQVTFEFIFKNLCAINLNWRSSKKSSYLMLTSASRLLNAHSKPSDGTSRLTIDVVICKLGQYKTKFKIKFYQITKNNLVIPIVCATNSAAANTFYSKGFMNLAFFKSI